jgi:hypothetical protein
LSVWLAQRLIFLHPFLIALLHRLDLLVRETQLAAVLDHGRDR